MLTDSPLLPTDKITLVVSGSRDILLNRFFAHMGLNLVLVLQYYLLKAINCEEASSSSPGAGPFSKHFIEFCRSKMEKKMH